MQLWWPLDTVAVGIPAKCDPDKHAKVAPLAVPRLSIFFYNLDDLRDAFPSARSNWLRLSPTGAVKVRRALAMAEAIVEKAVDDVAAEDIKAAAKKASDTEGASGS